MNGFSELELKMPVSVLNSIGLYVQHGIVPASNFLRAVINNDLQAAINEADDVELDILKPLLQYLKERTPTGCHGHQEAIDHWNKRKQSEDSHAEGC